MTGVTLFSTFGAPVLFVCDELYDVRVLTRLKLCSYPVDGYVGNMRYSFHLGYNSIFPAGKLVIERSIELMIVFAFQVITAVSLPRILSSRKLYLLYFSINSIRMYSQYVFFDAPT